MPEDFYDQWVPPPPSGRKPRNGADVDKNGDASADADDEHHELSDFAYDLAIIIAGFVGVLILIRLSVEAARSAFGA